MAERVAWSAARLRRASALDVVALASVALVVLVLFREPVRGFPIVASILRELVRRERVPRETILRDLRSRVPSREAERQVDTAVDWGRWADLFDYDADDGCFFRTEESQQR